MNLFFADERTILVSWFKIRMIRFLFIFVFFLGLASCESKEENSSNASENSTSIDTAENPEKLKDNKIKTH